MQKRFTFGTKTVEVKFLNSANQDCGDSELNCECDWSGKVEGLEQTVEGKQVNLQCPSCSKTLAEVKYAHVNDGAQLSANDDHKDQLPYAGNSSRFIQ